MDRQSVVIVEPMAGQQVQQIGVGARDQIAHRRLDLFEIGHVRHHNIGGADLLDDRWKARSRQPAVAA